MNLPVHWTLPGVLRCWIGYLILKKARRAEDGLMLGIGHGGIEAMILIGILTAGSLAQLFLLRGVDLTSMNFSAEQIAYLQTQLDTLNQTPLMGLLPLVERLMAMTLHIILSKFTAQAIVYLAAFLIAEVLAYVYILVLFEPISFGLFSIINGLLVLWLLCFSAITVLGSTLSRSIGTAAGISLAGSVVLLLSGQIPRYGALSPQALMGWVGILSSELRYSPQTSNFAAVGAAVVLIIMLLVWAVGLFEQQEI
jgi:hypothetical protein